VECVGQTSVTLVFPLLSLIPVKKWLSPPSGGFSRKSSLSTSRFQQAPAASASTGLAVSATERERMPMSVRFMVELS
jgi:hypothetical protein